MKRFITLLLLVMVAMITTAQERSLPSSTTNYVFDRYDTGLNYSYYSYTGGTSDYLIPTTRDSILFRYEVPKHEPYDFNVVMTYDKIAGIDTTVTVLMLGRNSLNESWTTISTNVSSVVSGQITQSISNAKTASIAGATDTFNADSTTTVAARTITFSDKVRYRYLGILCILTGNDSVGTGVKIIKAEIKLWE